MKSNSKQHTTNETLHSLSMTTHSGTHSFPDSAEIKCIKTLRNCLYSVRDACLVFVEN